MNSHEEHLQQQIERGVAVTGPEAEAYRSVFSALQREPSFTLPSNFADQVVQRVLAEAARKEALRDRWWFIAGGVVLAAALIVSLVLVNFKLAFKPGVGVFTFFAGYPGLVLFGLGFVLLLHFIDRKFIRTVS